MSETFSKRNLNVGLYLLAVFLIGIGIGTLFYKRASVPPSLPLLPPPTVKVATILKTPRALPPFNLLDHRGKPFNVVNLLGKWTFVFFGFTNCPYICPTTLTELQKMYQGLQQKHIKVMPQVIMVTVDPARDGVSVMRKYVTTFNPSFIGVTGNAKSLQRLQNILGIVSLKRTGPNNTTEIDHSGTILLLNPHGKVYAIFSMPHQSELLTNDYLSITRQG